MTQILLPLPLYLFLLSFLCITKRSFIHSFAPRIIVRQRVILRTIAFAEQQQQQQQQQPFVSLTLDKPLGMLLEEVEIGIPKGVIVQELIEGGSAFTYKDQLLGLQLGTIQGDDVTAMDFDTVMEKIIAAASPLTIQFLPPRETITPTLETGATVTIVIRQDGNNLPIQAQVGDNLRTTLLANNIDLYRGLKKKIGNCGGGGQCTFCAVKFLTSEGWAPRSDYEERKIGKFKDARLACMNNIQGPATIEIQ